MIVVTLIIIIVTTIDQIAKRVDRHRLDELFLLDTIKSGVSSCLDTGGLLPTNWMSLSNSVDWNRVLGICDYNHLPSPTTTYFILPQPITNKATGGILFLVSSKPVHWPGRFGRWALVKGAKGLSSASSSNNISRVWIPEESLEPEIRSQLKSQ